MGPGIGLKVKGFKSASAVKADPSVHLEPSLKAASALQPAPAVGYAVGVEPALKTASSLVPAPAVAESKSKGIEVDRVLHVLPRLLSKC